MEVNSTGTIQDFSLVLTELILTEKESKIFSTATNDMVASSYDGQQIACYRGLDFDYLWIEVAGRV